MYYSENCEILQNVCHAEMKLRNVIHLMYNILYIAMTALQMGLDISTWKYLTRELDIGYTHKYISKCPKSHLTGLTTHFVSYCLEVIDTKNGEVWGSNPGEGIMIRAAYHYAFWPKSDKGI